MRMRTALCMALLASTAACGGGGGGGSTTAGGASGGVSTAGMPPTTFQSPAAVMAADGTTTLVADQNSTFNSTGGTNPQADPVILHVNINGGGVAYTNTYDLSNTLINGPTNPAFQQMNFQETDPTKNGNNDGSSIVFDDTLTFSQYGIWKGPAGQVAAFAAAGPGGAPTPTTGIPTSGSATYSGEAIGAGQTSGNTFSIAGPSSFTIDFASEKITGQIPATVTDDKTGTAAPFTIATTQGLLAPNSSKGSGTWQMTTTSAIVPTALNGGFTTQSFGPAAQELSGTGNLAGGNTTAVVAFGGTQGQPAPAPAPAPAAMLSVSHR